MSLEKNIKPTTPKDKDKNVFKISVCSRYDPSLPKRVNNSRVAHGWLLKEFQWDHATLRNIVTTMGISMQEYIKDYKIANDWFATHAVMLDFDNGDLSSDLLLQLQQLLPYNTYLYASQNYMVPVDGHPPIEKMRMLIPLDSPIRDKDQVKLLESLFLRKFKSSIDSSFMGKARYFAHGKLDIDSFIGDRGFLDWKKLPGFGANDANVRKSDRKRGSHSLSAYDISVNTFRIDDKIRDENGDYLRIRDALPGMRIFCPKCGDAPWRGNSAHNAKFFINRRSTPVIYCSSCDSRKEGVGNAGIYELHPDDYMLYYYNEENPFVFEDIITGFYYGREFDVHDDVWKVHRLSSRDNLANFCKCNKIPVPIVVPRLSYVYKFNSNKVIDIDAGYVNKYQPTQLIQLLPVEGTKYEMPTTIGRSIRHITGDDQQMYNHFIKWLAYFIQNRKKMVTSFLFQGTEGTGKGIFFDHVLAPIVGSQFCSQASQDRFGTQFNPLLADFVLVMVNEVHIDADDRGDSTQQKIKQAITDQNTLVERKSIDARKEITICTLIFATNSYRGVVIPYNDRRFNVCPRQEVAIRSTRWFQSYTTWCNNVTRELPDFVRYLKTIDVTEEEIGYPIDNDARRKLQALSTTTPEVFFDAVLRGDIEWFHSQMYRDPSNENEYDLIDRILDASLTRGNVTTKELCQIYNFINRKKLPVTQFGRMASNRLGESQRLRIAGAYQRGYIVDWKDDIDIDITDDDINDITDDINSENLLY